MEPRLAWRSAEGSAPLATSASRGGNLMLNMGPDGRGRFPEGAQKRLLAVGEWLKTNGETLLQYGA